MTKRFNYQWPDEWLVCDLFLAGDSFKFVVFRAEGKLVNDNDRMLCSRSVVVCEGHAVGVNVTIDWCGGIYGFGGIQAQSTATYILRKLDELVVGFGFAKARHESQEAEVTTSEETA